MAALWDGTRERFDKVAAVRQRAVGARQQFSITALQRFFQYKNVARMTWVRKRRPILKIGSKFVLVTRREDVLTVLDDPAAFPPPYTTGLAAGFVLGLTGADYDRHHAAVKGLLLPGEHLGLQEEMAEIAAQAVAEADSDEMAVGRELVYPVLLGLVTRYVGIDGPSPDRVLKWSRAIFQDIFLNNRDMSVISDRGDVAVAEFKRIVRRSIAERRTVPVAKRPVDLLTRILAVEKSQQYPEGLTEDEMVDNIIGLAIGWFWHGAKAVLVALDGLLDIPEAFEMATDAARTDDMEQLQRVLWEVLRFRPVQAGLPRRCAHGATLGQGTPYETEIPAGAYMIVGSHSAMWDESVVPDPDRFDATRPAGQYLVFGGGPHHCMGEELMRGQLPAILAPLLMQRRLRRVADGRGRLQWKGPATDDLWVQFSR